MLIATCCLKLIHGQLQAKDCLKDQTKDLSFILYTTPICCHNESTTGADASVEAIYIGAKSGK